MFNFIRKLFGQEDRYLGATRSNKWPEFRKKFLMGKVCAVCGGKDKIELHHIQAFHIKPELELSESNVIPLCESKKWGITCHLWFGHLGNYQRGINPDVENDAKIWAVKFQNRSVGSVDKTFDNVS